ncbi:MAG: RNA 2',3'-cyclic phosphodiesterase [Anaerolineales bacterium]
MTVVRTFIAIEMPKVLQRALDKASVNLRRQMADLPIRWLRTDNIHLTLKFIGETSEEIIPRIVAIIEEQASKVTPFEIQLGGLGVFPNPRKPLVLWVGVQAPATLLRLQQGIEVGLTQLGIAAEERPFHPHLTLGRVRRDHRVANLKRMGELMVAAGLEPSPSALIDSVTLFRSDLKPGGSVYNPLSRNPLLGN